MHILLVSYCAHTLGITLCTYSWYHIVHILLVSHCAHTLGITLCTYSWYHIVHILLVSYCAHTLGITLCTYSWYHIVHILLVSYCAHTLGITLCTYSWYHIVHILLVSYCAHTLGIIPLHTLGITKMDMYVLVYSANKHKQSKTHSNSPVQCSIPVVHSTVCTHPTPVHIMEYIVLLYFDLRWLHTLRLITGVLYIW